MDLYATNTDGRSRSIYNSTHAGPIATNRNESTSLNREQRTGEKPGGTRDSPLGTGGGEGGRLGGGSQLSEARRGERGAMPSWGMPFYLRCAATARATTPRTPRPVGPRARSGRPIGRGRWIRVSPARWATWGWFHAGYFDSPDTRIRCEVSNTERRVRLAENRAVRTWLVGNGGARVECGTADPGR
jgi:hypothetical protein